MSKAKKIKYYAFYESPTSYELCRSNEIESYDSGWARNMEPFQTLKEAKIYLIGNFMSDISEAKSCIKMIRNFRK